MIKNFDMFFALPYFIQYLFIFIIGACIGSFINVLAHRLPLIFDNNLQDYINSKDKTSTENKEQHKSINSPFTLSQPSSHCPHCGYTLKWFDNIPLISFIILKAKCRNCAIKISYSYLLVELCVAVFSVFIYATLGNNILSLSSLIFLWLICAIAILDAKTQLLPNELSEPLIYSGLFISLFGFFVDAPNSIMGFLTGFCIIWVVAYVFKLIKGYDGMGGGDPYLLGGIGAWAGSETVLYTIFSASIMGILWVIFRKLMLKKPMHEAIAFGPFMGICGLLLFIYKYNQINL